MPVHDSPAGQGEKEGHIYFSEGPVKPNRETHKNSHEKRIWGNAQKQAWKGIKIVVNGSQWWRNRMGKSI